MQVCTWCVGVFVRCACGCVQVCAHYHAVEGVHVGGTGASWVVVCALQTSTTVPPPPAASRFAPTAPVATSAAAMLATGSVRMAAGVRVSGGRLGWLGSGPS